MPNGTHGDHPVLDLIAFGEHPFPSQIEELVLKIHELNPSLIEFLDVWAWEKGERIEQGVADMREMLDRFPKEGFDYLDEVVDRQTNPRIRNFYRFRVKALRNPEAHLTYSDPIDKPSLCAFIVVGVLLLIVLMGFLWRFLGSTAQ